MKIDRVYVDAEGVVRMSPTGWPNLPVKILTDRHSTYVRDLKKAKEESIPFEDNIGALFLIAGYFVKNEKVRGDVHKNTFYTIEPIQVELDEVECDKCEGLKGIEAGENWYPCKHCNQTGVSKTLARIVTEEEKPMPTINDTYWTAMLTLSARIPKGASLLLAYETDQAICVTNSKTPEHHSCTEMGCINDSHVIYRLPKVKYAPKAPLDQPIRFPQPAPVVDKPVHGSVCAKCCGTGSYAVGYSITTKVKSECQKLLSVQQPIEWVPVSRELPKEPGAYITIRANGIHSLDHWYPFSSEYLWLKCYMVTHYLPISSLPEPPKP